MVGRVTMLPEANKKYEVLQSKHLYPVPYDYKTSNSRKNYNNIQNNLLIPSPNSLMIMHEQIEDSPRRSRPLARKQGHQKQDSSSSDCSFQEEESRSFSPNVSIRSGQSSPSEGGADSGVCSEHDTPPPKPRKLQNHIVNLDSDNDSNLSSDSIPDQIRDSPPLWTPSSYSKKSKYRHAFQDFQPQKRLPDSLLLEIKGKYRELKKKRKLLRGDLVALSAERNPISRAVSYHRSGRLSRLNNSGSLNYELSMLSLAASSNYSSMTSIYTEDDDTFNSGFSLNDYKMSLWECPDKSAKCGFAGINDIFGPQQESTIKSCKGTVRGVKNRVRAGIVTFNSDQRLLKLFADRERGKVVVYVTTLGIIRSTYEKCLRVRKILWTLLVHFEERDIFMSRNNQLQLLDRMRDTKITVPHIFLEGQYLGGVEVMERLNENGELRRILHPYMGPPSTIPCESCGGFRLMPCTVCSGSKKSVHRNDFTLEFVALKCSACDESGLVQCQDCTIPN